ncbi:Ribonucleoside-diphosphate reductase large subunit [Arachis hypogaea]|nr:Ribonucleoside-diphosphate reductase large subunit [Arachis hypogaea]
MLILPKLCCSLCSRYIGSFHIFVIRGLARDSEIQKGSVLEAEVEMFKKFLEIKLFEDQAKTLVNIAVDSGCYIYQSPSLNILMDYPNFKKMTSLQFHDWPKVPSFRKKKYLTLEFFLLSETMPPLLWHILYKCKVM